MNAVEDMGKSNLSITEKVRNIIIFTLLFLLPIAWLNWWLKPEMLTWENNELLIYKGVYQEPRNTVQTVFLGSSQCFNAFDPMLMYQEQGICAYNLGVEEQPIMLSYYALKDAYRLHSETLNTAVLEVAMLRRDPPDAEKYRLTLDKMSQSRNKLEAASVMSNNHNTFFELIVPLLAYHDRWVSSDEIANEKKQGSTAYMRGYAFIDEHRLNYNSYQELILPHDYALEATDRMQINDESLYYLDKMVDFCKQHNIKLVLTKTPVSSEGWSGNVDLAVEEYAREHHLDFIDFTRSKYLEEVDFCFPDDLVDGFHNNYFGSRKLSSWFARYLVNECENKDIRGISKYDYMEKQLTEYEQSIYIRRASMRTGKDVCEYLSRAMTYDDCDIFISVKDDATVSLTDEQREVFNALGLKKLSKLQRIECYIGIIENRKVIYEKTLSALDMENEDKNEYLKKRGTFLNHEEYRIISGGFYNGNVSSIKIDGQEYSPNKRGINIVIYDRNKRKVIDAKSFDVCICSLAGGNLQQQIKAVQNGKLSYQQLDKEAKDAWLWDRSIRSYHLDELWRFRGGKDQLFAYLSLWLKEMDYSIFIAAHEEASESMDQTCRDLLARMGLLMLSQLSFRDSYIGIIDDGKVFYEQAGHGEFPIVYLGIDHRIVSGGFDSGNCSSICVNNQEYSFMQRGLNIVVYDKQLQRVVSHAVFDTNAIPVNVSEEMENNVA